MSFPNTTSGLKRLPEDYIAISIAEDQKPSLLKICVLVRPEPDSAGGHLVVLRNTIDAKILLGCIVDVSNQVLNWLELWIQNSVSLINTPVVSRMALSNAVLDDRWQRQFRALEQLDATTTITTGFEISNPLPTFLDISAGTPVHPIDPDTGTPWKLCKDEGLLQQKGLPSYSSSLHRYLYIPASASDTKFVPVTPGAPTNESTRPLSELHSGSDIISFNNAAGLMLVKKHQPIDLETYVDILSGAQWDGLKHGSSILDLGEQFDILRKNEMISNQDGRLFLGSQGKCGRLIETLHLKLQLLANIVSSVYGMAYYIQRPLFNVSPKSWQIQLGDLGRGLPFLWTAKAVLCDPGDAMPLAIESSNLQCYLPSPLASTSIYRPLVSSLPVKGTASVRIRSVLSEANDTTIVDGTFTTQERIEITSHDLVWLRINLARGDINLYAHLESDSAMAAGEWRFRTLAQHLKHSEDLKAAEGIPMTEVLFEIIPLLSSPCDLYSLAVLAIRILLINKTNSLPEVLDETLSLMRQIETDYNETSGLENRISEIFNKDDRWYESLGPQHLIFDEIGYERALKAIPSELWWEILGIILRMFPGLGPDSVCKDYGDAQPGGLHKVFKTTLDDLDKVILKTRSLIVSDWESNQEISMIIKKYLV